MLIWLDGFDDYPDSNLTSVGYIDGGGYLFISNESPTGIGRSLGVSTGTAGGNGSWEKAFGNYSHIIVGAHYNCGEFTDNIPFTMRVGDGEGHIDTILTLFGNEKRGLSVLNSGGSLIAETPPNLVFPNVWYYIEWEVDFPAGKIIVRVNDTEVLNELRDLGGSSQIVNIVGGGSRSWSSSGSTHQLWDNFYIVAPELGGAFNTFMGEIVVFTARPDADVGPNNWETEGLGLSGHYDAVDDITYDDGDYLHIVNPDTDEWFSIVDVPDDTLEVLAVGVAGRVSKDGGGGVGRYQLLAAVGEDALALPVRSANTNAFTKLEIMEGKPGGGAWTIPDANGLNIGIRSAA